MDSNNRELVNRQQLSPCSIQETALSRAERLLAPATAKAGTAELLACLTLVAPSGMTAEDRTAWVAVAKETLSGIPGVLLATGCKKARETCRFASEIVPTIMETVSADWEWRRRNVAEQAPRLPRPVPEAIPREETQRILREAREPVRSGRA